MSLVFSSMYLLIGDKNPSAEDMKSAFVELNDLNDGYQIMKENLNDKYFWLYARYGKSLPYSKIVFNTNVNKNEKNPRITEQIELNKQLFAIYCVESRVFYLSNKKTKSWIEIYLKEKLKQEVVIKSFYKNVDEFLEQIKNVEKVKFVRKNNLFSLDGGISKIFPIPKDPYGLGEPCELMVEMNYLNAKKTNSFIKKLKNLYDMKKTNEIDSLICVGRDDKNFESVFNADSFTQKITVEAKKDKEGLYDPTEVKHALMYKIRVYDED